MLCCIPVLNSHWSPFTTARFDSVCICGISKAIVAQCHKMKLCFRLDFPSQNPQLWCASLNANIFFYDHLFRFVLCLPLILCFFARNDWKRGRKTRNAVWNWTWWHVEWTKGMKFGNMKINDMLSNTWMLTMKARLFPYLWSFLLLSSRCVAREADNIAGWLTHIQTLTTLPISLSHTHTYTHTSTHVQRFRALTYLVLLHIHTHIEHIHFANVVCIRPITRIHWKNRSENRPASLLVIIMMRRTQSLFVSPFPEYFCLRMMTSDATYDTFWYSLQQSRTLCMWRFLFSLFLFSTSLHIISSLISVLPFRLNKYYTLQNEIHCCSYACRCVFNCLSFSVCVFPKWRRKKLRKKKVRKRFTNSA